MYLVTAQVRPQPRTSMHSAIFRVEFVHDLSKGILMKAIQNAVRGINRSFKQPSAEGPNRQGSVTGVMALALLLAAGPALAVIPKGVRVDLETVASGLRAPIGAVHAGDGSGRLFIIDQSGRILILAGGVVQPTPFLDITAKLPVLNPGYDERGLLGVAFHPRYAQNGRFFVRYSGPRTGAPGEPCVGTARGCHEEILAEYHVSVGNPDQADPASGVVLFRVKKPQFNHNGGMVAFGPDGYLYFGLGDGGGANDGLADVPPTHGPIGNGQNKDVPLGKLLRIDVDGASPYVIPPDNPFVGGPGLDEVYAYGIRNPYRFAFDSRPGGDGRLILGEVGQNQFEEIDFVQKGGNYGWVVREGLHCFDPFSPNIPPGGCPSVGLGGEPLLDPVVEYSHAEGGIAVTGGYVYRGACASSLRGKYVFGDFSSAFNVANGRLYYLDEPAPGAYAIREFRLGAIDLPLGLFVKGFGEAENGDLFVCGTTALGPSGVTGVVQRIVPEECRPTPVVLSRLAVRREADAAVLSWEVSEAIDHAGFKVYRQAGDGGRTALTAQLLSGRAAYEYRDADAPRAGADYWLEEIGRSGAQTWFGPVTLGATTGLATRLTLAPASPNPFQAATTLGFSLPRDMNVQVGVFDIQGRTVATLLSGARAAGDYRLTWDGHDRDGQPAPAGFYVVRIDADGDSQTRKILLSR